MTWNQEKGHAALRRGRVSIVGAEYFLTLCIHDRRRGLDKASAAAKIIDEMRAMETDGAWIIRCATIMHDHLHLLIVLGARLSLGKAVQRLKARTAVTLQKSGLKWEHDFFDRQLRVNDGGLPLFLYIYLNPYRKNLCASNRQWPWFICSENDWVWLREHLDDQLPPPEWLV
jgi:putative transposase